MLRTLCCLPLFLVCAVTTVAAEPPRAIDPRLKIELFAESPQIVTPTGITVLDDGRVLVIESHTHFRPDGYTGPPADRIQLMKDTDGDGRADEVSTFFEGTQATMNLAVYRDGSVFVATRNEVFRLFDTDHDGRSDRRQQLVKLETPGNYPHNGLSGFAFDFAGKVYFGFGENLGAPYKLTGSDGVTLSGGGEGGNIYRCQPDGSELQHVATGFWNPFHLCFDAFGRLFAVDNDPDWRPPCRLLHIVDGGDYGYRFRLGRRGTHPFTAWFGELPGTLPMVAGTGEAPCAVIAYESDQLPDDYRGDLLVTSWGLHAIERYRLKRHGATFKSVAEPVIKGDDQFRPVGLALAPDGSLFVSDWVDRSYQLHGKGRVWRISSVNEPSVPRLSEPRRALASHHRPLSEHAARKLARDPDGLDYLARQAAEHPDARVRAVAIQALGAVDAKHPAISRAYCEDDSIDVVLVAMQHAAARDPRPGSSRRRGAVADTRFRDAVDAARWRPSTGKNQHPGGDLVFPMSDDPFVRQAVRQAALRSGLVDRILREGLPVDGKLPSAEVAVLLRQSGVPDARRLIPQLLAAPDESTRFVAIQWIGEEQLLQYAPLLSASLKSSQLSGWLFDACLAALELLKQPGSGAKFEAEREQLLAELVKSSETANATKALALTRLRQLGFNGTRKQDRTLLPPAELRQLLSANAADVASAAVRLVRESQIPERQAWLREIIQDEGRDENLRAEAVLGMSAADGESRSLLIELAAGAEAILREEALRSLQGVSLTSAEVQRLEPRRDSDLVKRLITPGWKPDKRPEIAAAAAWQSWLGGGSAQRGARLFYHPQGPKCYACHDAEGGPVEVGPTLTTARDMSFEKLLTSVLAPSQEIAPRFGPVSVVTSYGKVVTGILISERGDTQTYVDAQGNRHYIRHVDIVERHPHDKSIMPDGLLDRLTDQEVRDLFAFLRGR